MMRTDIWLVPDSHCMTEKLLSMEQEMSRDDASEKLASLADKLREGKVELTAGDDSVSLEPNDRVELELEVEQETDGDLSIEIDIEWPETDENSDLEIQ